MKLGLWMLAAALVLTACADGSAFLEEDTDSLLPPPDEPGAAPVPIGDPCTASEECVQGASCVAPWNGEPTPLVCSAECVATEDESKWCGDDEACCNPMAICSSRGLCIVPDDGGLDDSGSGGSTGTGTGTGTGGGDTTGGTTGGSTDGGSGPGTTGGSGTTGATGTTGGSTG